MNKRIIHISNIHQPDDSRILTKQGAAAVNAGFETYYLTIAPEPVVAHGVHVIPLPRHVPLRKNPGKHFQILKTILREALDLHGDLYQFHDPELIPLALKLKKMGKRVVYDAHEYFPEQVLTIDTLGPAYARIKSLLYRIQMKQLARNMDGIIAATPYIAERFPREKTILAANFPILKQIYEAVGNSQPRKNNAIVYIGGLSKARGIENIIAALDYIDPVYRLNLAGSFLDEDLETRLKKHPNWNRVNFLGRLSHTDAIKFTASSKAGLMVGLPSPHMENSYPIKIFEYMALGLPIVASNFPLWRQMFGHFECIKFVDPRDPRAIGDACNQILANPELAKAMGQRGRQAVTEHYSWESQASRLIAFYRKILE